MIDLAGTTVSAEERRRLVNPRVGGVILFSRNYESPAQLEALVADIHALRTPPLLVAVDHEGGPVQRFRRGFSRLPAASSIGAVYDDNHEHALQLAELAGWLMAAELRAFGIDFSFAPVLDLRLDISRVVNDRAFHRDPNVVGSLAQRYVRGMHEAGMPAVAKHFPGHGSVSEDSHHELPVDDRRYADIRLLDLVPFERLVRAGVEAIMPAHVVYSRVDPEAAGYSRHWLQTVLRGELGFSGVIFSDDISMAGAAAAGGPVERCRAALAAGCDLVLVCNDPDAADAILEALPAAAEPASQVRRIRMHGRGAMSARALQNDARRDTARRLLAALDPAPELDLGDDALV